MSKALYRQFRPLSLADVVGQDQVTKSLESALRQGKISHAYLFVGPRGTGKTSVARIFAHQINGFDYENEDNYVDIIEIDGASNRGIDNIRELREKAAIAPTSGKYKIYIIDEVHMLTKEAFNALLKTLEEPPKHVIFIMATTDAYKIPATITSRAQTYVFRLANLELMTQYLRKVADAAKINIGDDALKLIAKHGGGSFRDSLSLLDQISTLPAEKITGQEVANSLGLPKDDEIDILIKACLARDLDTVSNMLKNLLLSGVKAETLAEEMVRIIIEKPSQETIPLLDKLVEVKSPFAEARLLVALASLTRGDEASRINQPSRSHSSPAPQARSGSPSVLTTRNEDPTPIQTPSATLAATSDAKDNTTVNPLMAECFDWTKFLETVRNLNDAIYSQLRGATFAINSKTLEIYPVKKIAKTILSRENNQRILAQAAPDFTIKIGDKPNDDKKNDALISRISDIMGGEVQNDGGGNPF